MQGRGRSRGCERPRVSGKSQRRCTGWEGCSRSAHSSSLDGNSSQRRCCNNTHKRTCQCLPTFFVALLQRRLVFVLPAKIASLALPFLYFLRRSSIFSFFLFFFFFLEINRWQTKGDDETKLDEFQGVERAQGNFRPRTEGLENLGNARCTKEGDSFEIPMEIRWKLTRRLKIDFFARNYRNNGSYRFIPFLSFKYLFQHRILERQTESHVWRED